MRRLLAAAAFLVCAPGAGAQETAQPNPIQALEDCVLAQARRLEISREPANIVADAAIANCGKELTAATPSGGVLRSSLEARVQLKDAMRESALVQVVEDRAAANAPKPPPAPPKPPAAKKKTP
jgi:hypothetical protein